MTDPDHPPDRDAPRDPDAPREPPAPGGDGHDDGGTAGEPDVPQDPSPGDGSARGPSVPSDGETPAARHRDGSPTASPVPPAASGSGAQGQRAAFDAGRQLRELRTDIDEVRARLAALLGQRETDRAQLQEANAWIVELVPRVDTLETAVRALTERIAPNEDDPGEPDAVVPAPAIGWDDLDHDAAQAAWDALAHFVDDVLHARYRLTRLQVPDCWPLHPRLIREFAWLRSSYLDAAAMEPDLPPAAAPWHTRALPPFLDNMLDAVDPRECRPGVHRLTEHEVEAHIARSNKARHEGQPAPALTSETGVDRPRLVPGAFPARGTAVPPRPGSDPSPPTVRTLSELIPGSCEPRWWIDYYREACAADLAHRPPAADPPPASPPDEPEDPDTGSARRGGEAGRGHPQRFDLDSSTDDLADGGPGAPGGPGGLGGLDGPAGPL